MGIFLLFILATYVIMTTCYDYWIWEKIITYFSISK
jgi:hypothetical protein